MSKTTRGELSAEPQAPWMWEYAEKETSRKEAWAAQRGPMRFYQDNIYPLLQCSTGAFTPLLFANGNNSGKPGSNSASTGDFLHLQSWASIWSDTSTVQMVSFMHRQALPISEGDETLGTPEESKFSIAVGEFWRWRLGWWEEGDRGRLILPCWHCKAESLGKQW